MGAYDFMWNSVQSGQIHELEERTKKLEEQVKILKEWVDYLSGQLNTKVSSDSGATQDCRKP
jgi:hypothetical protein